MLWKKLIQISLPFSVKCTVTLDMQPKYLIKHQPFDKAMVYHTGSVHHTSEINCSFYDKPITDFITGTNASTALQNSTINCHSK